MLKKYSILLFILLIVLTGCANDSNKIKSIKDLNNKKIGIYTGSEYDKLIKNKAKVKYYNSYSDEISALNSNKIDGFLTDEPLAKQIVKENPNLSIIPEKLTNDSYSFAINPNLNGLKEQIDIVIKTMKKDGKLEKFEKKWIKGEKEKLEKYKYKSSKTIKFATVSGSAPFAYMKNNKIVGYDIDVINYIGYKLGYKVEIIEMSFEAIIPALISGKVDLAGCSIIVTEDRKKSVLFSEPDYTGGIVIVTKSSNKFNRSFIKSFYRTLIEENRYKLLLTGLKSTVIISAFSIILGTVMGMIVCYFRRSGNTIISNIFKIYINLIQGIPITVLLLIFYYVIFGKIDINNILIAVLTFSIYFSAYVGEVFRGALNSINMSQIESAYALGFNKIQTLKYIILPQILSYTIPVYKNEIVSLIKLTSIAGYISIMDLTKASDIIRNRTYEAFFPLILTAIIYYLICLVIGKLLDYLYKKINPRMGMKKC